MTSEEINAARKRYAQDPMFNAMVQRLIVLIGDHDNNLTAADVALAAHFASECIEARKLKATNRSPSRVVEGVLNGNGN